MSQQTSYNESELLNRLAIGDETAMTILYDLYAKDLLNSAFNILKDRNTAQDIIQDTFLSLWIKRKTLNITQSLKSYLHTAVRYQVFKAIREGKTTESLFEQLEERIWGEPSAENLLYQKELQARLTQIVQNLPPKCQEVYRLSREQQLSHKEIASQLNITTKAVEFQITEALKRIRQSLHELLPLIALWLSQK